MGDKDYTVGFGRPPKHSQFKPGQSGNPKGRKKQDNSIRAMVQRISRETVVAKLPDGERSMQAIEFVLLSLRNRAAKGDNRATSQYIELTLMALGLGEINDKRDLVAEDRQLLRAALKWVEENGDE